MDYASISQRKTEIETRFTELDNEKKEIEDEMKRLQGEHRLIQDILSKRSEPAPTVVKPKRIRKVVEPDATT